MIIHTIKKLLGLHRHPNAEVDQATWDHQYSAGRWSYLEKISELAHYSLIVGYCQYFNKHGRILDVGCGNGVLQQRLSILPYAAYTGIDISQVAIDSAQAFSNSTTTFMAADAATFKPDNLYDIIIFNESLYCFNDCTKILSHYEKFLSAKGVMLISMHVQELSVKHWQAIDRQYRILDAVQLCNAENTEWVCKAVQPKNAHGSHPDSQSVH